MSFNNVQAALNTKLVTLGYAVAWENKPFNPETDVAEDTPFVKVDFMPAETQIIELGINGKNSLRGIYQVSIWAPIGLKEGDYQSRTYAEAILAAFKRGDELEYGTTLVRIIKSWKSPALETQSYYTVPVSIRWKAYVDN